jgi:NIMA (never in mitosis gene a)-related kinase
MAENIKYAPYKKKKLLGEGSFGKAYLVQNVNNGSYSVLKQVNLSRMRDNEKRSAYKEAEILKNLDHQNVVEIQDVFKT